MVALLITDPPPTSSDAFFLLYKLDGPSKSFSWSNGFLAQVLLRLIVGQGWLVKECGLLKLIMVYLIFRTHRLSYDCVIET